MNAIAILEKLDDLGVSATGEGEELVVRPGGKVPRDLIPEIREHKPEIVEHLRSRDFQNLHERYYQFRNSPVRDNQSEWDEIQFELDLRGCVLLWSEVLDDYIGVYGTEDHRSKIPPEFVPYSPEELWHIFGEGKPDVAENTIRLLHKAKVLGATITDSYLDKEIEDDKAE